MQWPVSREVYPDRMFLSQVQKTIARLANSIVDFEPVVMLMDARYQARAQKMLSAQVEIWDVPTEDLWSRDSGPLFVIDGKGGMAIRSLGFNGWGNKQTHENDAKIAGRVAGILGLDLLQSNLVGEPGGVETDGAGTLIAHESSWVNPNRNGVGKPEIEARLLAAYGAQKMIWAPGLAGLDITDDHIDALARFAGPGQVVIQLPDRIYAGDPWSQSAYKTLDVLENATDARGRKLKVMRIADPFDIRIKADDFVFAYVNYALCNGAVFAAQFGDTPADEAARAQLAALYPNREIITLNVDEIGESGGGIHCATQSQPLV
jgi:agmatine deiminase